MVKIIYTLTAIVACLALTSCEKVVTVDLETSQERLVIHALLNWEKGTTGNEQTITLQKTTSFYEFEVVPASGASVIITRADGMEFLFTETNPGIYTMNTFEPQFDSSYTLSINYNNELFTAETSFVPVPDIDEVTQTIENGFNSFDPEVNIFFTDVPQVENFYRIFFLHNRLVNGVLTPIESENFTYDDLFEDGNQLSDFYEYDDILPGDVFDISLLGITERFSRYINLIQTQGDAGVGPFASPPVNVKGNCVNETQRENYPYGYFGLSEVSRVTYTYQ